MRIAAGSWFAMSPAERAEFRAYAATQGGLHIDLDDLGCANDRTPPSAWTGRDGDKEAEIEAGHDYEVTPQQYGGF